MPAETKPDCAKLQVALDFLELSRALAAAREAVKGGADILEAGTPLIKSEGLDSVRQLRAEFPQIEIVADLKTMDAGRAEMEAAAKAGANAAMVLGVASESTLAECAEAGRNYGIRVGVDLLGVNDVERVAKFAEEIGVDHLSVHCPIDDQMRGGNPFERLKALSEITGLPLSVAGGINSETAPKAVEAGASVVIVGGAVIKATDAEKATRDIKRAIATGKPVATELFRRVTDEQISEVLSKISAANLSDALHRGGVLEGIRPIRPGLRMFGRAVTARTYPGDWAKPVQAIEVAGPGEIVVIDAGGVPPAVWGELATESSIQRGLAGVVIDGAIRDSGEIRELGFPAFARHICPNAGEPKGFGELNVPVTLAGKRVSPGDLILGDDDGVVVVEAARAAEYVNRAMDVLEKENRLREEIRRGSTLSEVAELLRWEKRG